MNELPSNEHCRVSTGLKEEKRQEGSRESLTVPAGPVGLIRPSVPRAANCRQEIRGTSLSHEGGTGGLGMGGGGVDKRERRGEERRANVWKGRSEWKSSHDSEVESFLPGGWLVFHSSFLTLIKTSGN